MKIHIFSRELEVIEFDDSDEPSPEEIEMFVRENLKKMGLEPWPSVELEVFTYNSRSLVFASPVKVYIPGFLAALTGER